MRRLSSDMLGRMRTSLLALAVAGVLAAAAACTGDDPVLAAAGADAGGVSEGGPGTDAAMPPPGDAAPEASGPTFLFEPARPRLVRGGTVDVTVTLDRKTLTGAIPLTVTDLPMGVTADVLPIAAGSSVTTMKLTASPTAAMGVAPIVVSAPGASNGTPSIVVAGTAGTIDTSLDQDGFVIDTSVASGIFNAVAVQPDGKIIAVGSTNTASGNWVIKRFADDGTPDAAFNVNVAANQPTNGAAYAIAFDPQKGRIYVVGGSGGEYLTVRRLNADGTPDQSYASAGTLFQTPMIHSQGSRGLGAIVRSDSSIIVVGTKGTDPLLESYDAAGLRNDAFFVTPLTSGQFSGIFQLSSGFVVTGHGSPPQSQRAERFLVSGARDAAFGTGGAFTFGAGCSAAGAALTPSGTVVVAGGTQSITSCTSNAILSAGGLSTWSHEISQGGTERLTGITVGGLAATAETSYAVGFGGGSQDRHGVLYHRIGNGDLDAAWGTGGVVRLEDPVSPDGYGYQPWAVTSTKDGRIVLAGGRSGVNAGFFLARIWE
jgi:uncharacterized delta-60 repeat protein